MCHTIPSASNTENINNIAPTINCKVFIVIFLSTVFPITAPTNAERVAKINRI